MMKLIAINVPPSVAAILNAAGANSSPVDGMPHAIASLIGAIPFVAVALFRVLSPDEYQRFLQQVRLNLDQVMTIIESDDPPATFDQALEMARELAKAEQATAHPSMN